ncbi:2-amino-4-hydroxy-6-hydroxymethyldihydropteridine diphosphokinase [Elusimicrobium simillimum]|uniref:2-amino-4-hydroxy-6- hydroxymethyldihydropteridine diphosphokinase n=1 Tax=Elusimicrobium simillimum TaxID=3143438 RepID=UPI003C6F793D
MSKAFIALGGNKDDAFTRLQAAVREVKTLGVVEAVSSVYTTKPEGYAEQPDFLNAVLILQTSLTPLQLLARLKEIETRLGRTPTFRNGPREIDLDIILFDDIVLESENLTVPHPRAQERLFVLEPLCELDGGVIFPNSGTRASKLKENLKKNTVAKFCKKLLI